MKTLIVIVTPISQFGEIENAKDLIVKYLGSRMIETNPSEMPALIVNTGLDTVDKNAIVSIVNSIDDRCTTLFIESEKEIPGNAYYILEL